MAGFTSDSGSEYDLDLTTSDEELLWAIVDRLSAGSALPPAIPATPATPARRPIASTPFSPDLDPDATLAVEEAIAAIADDDLSFDISELHDGDDGDDDGDDEDDDFNDDDFDDDDFNHGQTAARRHDGASRNSTPERENRRLAPSVSGDDDHLASFVSKTNPRSMPRLLPGPDVHYPDLSGALSEAQDAARFLGKAKERAKDSTGAKQSPLLRFRTFPMKPLSVTDLTSGSWCELQHYYTLTRLGGRKTRTPAMKRGTKVHEKLEREIFTPVQIEIAKKEDAFCLKIWNMIQGLRVLRNQGFTREFEVWGMVDGNVVCGVIDGLSYENPDIELQEDVLSSRGSSQAFTNSPPCEPSTPGDSQIFITDVKTRNSATPPRQPQVRVSIIQLFLYHRFMSDVASDRLDYMRVFERYGLNPDEPFSDSFMAQIADIHEEVLTEADDTATSCTLDDDRSSSTNDAGSNAEFVSAPSSPSQLSFASSTTEPALQYRTLRTLLPLLKFELHLTFPRGAADLGNIVAVEYRYRGRDPPPSPPTAPSDSDTATVFPTTRNPALTQDETDPVQSPHRQQQQQQQQQQQEPESGSVICTNTFFVEPETLDLFLAETMRWWKGEREPRGVAIDEAGFKCRPCEFADVCAWRKRLDLETLRRARRRSGLDVDVDMDMDMGVDMGVDIGGVPMDAETEREMGDVDTTREEDTKRRGRGRPRKVEKEVEVKVEREADAEAGDVAEGSGARTEPVKRGRGRPRKAEKVAEETAAAVTEGELEVMEGETSNGPVKRGRGRPRKVVGVAQGVRW